MSQNEVTFIIDSCGDMKYLLTDAAKSLDFGGTPRRASYVEPTSFGLRLAFHAIRKMVADDSRIAEWTRKWPCLWRVNLRPIGGGLLQWDDPFGRGLAVFYNRAAAIDAEVVAINRFWTTGVGR